MINCAIIKDLLPLYADEVLSPESTELVSQHLESCENCKNELANMQAPIEKANYSDDAQINVLRRMKKKITRQKVTSAVMTCVVVLVAAFVINNFVAINAAVGSDSMDYTIRHGDRVVAFRGSYLFNDPERYDIVIIRRPGDRVLSWLWPGGDILYLKRIIGLPGETLIIQGGHVYINGSSTPQRYDFVRGPLSGDFGVVNPETGELEPITIPEGHYFMLGDNRAASYDSRYWDEMFVPRRGIMGRAVFTYFPRIASLRNR